MLQLLDKLKEEYEKGDWVFVQSPFSFMYFLKILISVATENAKQIEEEVDEVEVQGESTEQS